MRIPYYLPQQFDPSLQIVNFGTGGPQSHMGLRALAPRSYPTAYNITLSGMGPMPRQIIGPTNPTVVNNYSNPLTLNNLEINGLFKNPRGG
jgi:hypothetical protein